MTTATVTMLDEALGYLARGWSVFPLDGKKPRVDWKPYQERLPTEDQVREWWTDWPDAGIALVLGKISSVVRIDADGEGGVQEFRRRGCVHTLEFTTPSGGYGWLYEYSSYITTKVLWKGEGQHQELRIQSDGAYTVLPPSPHPKGGNYAWIDADAPVALYPRWVQDIYAAIKLRELAAELRPNLKQPSLDEVKECLEHIPADDYDTWIKVGMCLHSADALDLWIEWSRKAEDKFVEGECERKWASFNNLPGGYTLRTVVYLAREHGFALPSRWEPITELGFARMLARTACSRLKHSSVWEWIAWDGKRWDKEDAEKAADREVKAVLTCRLDMAVESLARHLKLENKAADHEQKRKGKLQAIGTIRQHETRLKKEGIKNLASSEESLSVKYREFDQHPFLLNCANGTVDLTTGQLLPHDPEHKLTQLCPTEYLLDAKCPRWKRFMEEILPDENVRKFLKQFLGSCLTGDTSPQVMPVLWGSGANGKSTLIETMFSVLGDDYCKKASRALLMSCRYGGTKDYELVELRGKRFVACIESEEDGRLDETTLKEMTGGDTISAREIYKKREQFTPTHKVVLATNHKPDVRGTDEGIWRRLPLVPFTQTFPAGSPKRDPELASTLKRELQGILVWLVEGCQEWLKDNKKLTLPAAVRAATQEYRQEQDDVAQFLKDCFVEDPESRVPVKDLTSEYTVWCSTNRKKAKSKIEFGKAITEKGYDYADKSEKYRKGLKSING